MKIPGINFNISEDEEDDDIIFRTGKYGNALAIDKDTGEILNRKLEEDEKRKKRNIKDAEKEAINVTQNNIGIKYNQTFNLHGYTVKHTHYDDDSQRYEIYKNNEYITTVYTTEDLYDAIKENEDRKD